MLNVEGSRVEYEKLVETTKECLESTGTRYIELYFTPIKAGYVVEVFPELSYALLEDLATCISRKLGLSAELRTRPYGVVVVVKG